MEGYVVYWADENNRMWMVEKVFLDEVKAQEYLKELRERYRVCIRSIEIVL